MIQATREQRRELARENAKRPIALAKVPMSEWPGVGPSGCVEVWRSRDFLVQVFAQKDGGQRLSILRTTLGDNGRWVDGITWDELQRLKRECGRGEMWAVELFPADSEMVNVANQLRDLRGKAGTDLEDLALAQKLLGHRSRSMTERYIKPRAGDQVSPVLRTPRTIADS